MEHRTYQTKKNVLILKKKDFNIELSFKSNSTKSIDIKMEFIRKKDKQGKAKNTFVEFWIKLDDYDFLE